MKPSAPIVALAAAVTFAAALALAGDDAPLPKVDLDGDGKPEKIAQTEEGLQLGDGLIPCEGFDFPCDVTALDIRKSDAFKELLVCEHGPRDFVTCQVWTVRDGKPLPLAMTAPGDQALYVEKASSTGWGILLADEGERYWTRRHKLTLSEDGRALKYVPQAHFNVDATVHVDRTFPITTEPGGGSVVANVAPDSDIRILLEHGSKRGVFLIRVSSGLVGWTTQETLMNHSDQLMGILMAG